MRKHHNFKYGKRNEMLRNLVHRKLLLAHSRNRSLGFLIGKGLPLPKALSQTKMVAEGYHACASIYKILINLKRNYDAPILNCAYNIMHLGNDPQTEITTLIPLIS